MSIKTPSKSPVSAFGSRVTNKIPPFSEIEHISNQDKLFALYLANIDTDDTTIRVNKSKETSNVNVNRNEDSESVSSENKCTNLACQEVIRKINVAGKKNRTERDDLAYEQSNVNLELNDLEDILGSLEAECNKIDNDAQNFESTKTEMISKLGKLEAKKKYTEKETQDLNSKIMMAETERGALKNKVQDLSKILSNLMWKGKRVATADEVRGRNIIPSIHITRANEKKVSAASVLSNTPYYDLVADNTLDFSERSVAASYHSLSDDNPQTYPIHYFVPGCQSIASLKTSKSKKLSKKKDDNSTIDTSILDKTVDTKSVDNHTLPGSPTHIVVPEYRNSVSINSIKPYPSFTQPFRWGTNQATKQTTTTSTTTAYDYTLKFDYNSPYHTDSLSVSESHKLPNGSPDPSRNKKLNSIDATPISSLTKSLGPIKSPPSRYLIINRVATPTSMPSDSNNYDGFDGLEFPQKDKYDDSVSLNSTLTEDSSMLRNKSISGRTRKKNRDDKELTPSVKLEPWMLLNPIFYKEKSRVQFGRNTKVGKQRVVSKIETIASSPLLDLNENITDNDLNSEMSKSQSSSFSSAISTGSRLLTSKNMLRERLHLTPISPHMQSLQWKSIGKNVYYPGRPPTKLG